MMRPGLPVLLSLLAACNGDAPADTEAASSTTATSTATTGDTTPTTGEPLPPLSGVADPVSYTHLTLPTSDLV